MTQKRNISKNTAEIVADNLDKLVRFAFFRTGNRDFAEDLVHDAVVRLTQSNATPRNIKVYLFRILYNLCVDFCKNRHESISIDDIEEPSYSPEQEEDILNEQQHVVNSLECLSEEKRQIVMMRAVDNLKFAEIAEIMSKPLTTVQSQYKSAISELKSIFFKSDDL